MRFFILKMCNLLIVTHIELSLYSALPLRSRKCVSVFHLIWFSLRASINLVSSSNRQLLQFLRSVF